MRHVLRNVPRDVLRTHVSVFLLLLSELLLAQAGLLSAVALAATTAVAAAITLCAVAVAAARTGGPLTPTRIRTAIRDRELRTAFLAQRDPDAQGRRRPRAPGLPLPASA
ncbi:DUF6412 domain-containing protein [Streptomyces griseocarneus]|uniref:DUF6412 domain-containing protein n=1 Tax=Streptomyces griseocarneus TaxID=51201 RepID=UPI001996FA15|nr:DUF6412 domain-containing protein [Streptomyces griseocarneus]MBZ6477051.1 DUF6412 domain-containing protein [Streptomyces griseocarneus]GHG70178.1 hypothetical protein GCM10018779_44050 [Streptomyces griseocarneus]